MHLNKVIKLIRFILFLLSLGTSYSFADSNYSKDIEKFAETLVFNKYKQEFELPAEQILDIQAISIPDRVNLKKCSVPLQASIVGDHIKSKTSVKISCADIENWNIYIRVKVNVLVPIIVTEKPMTKGDTLNDNNTQLIFKPKSQIRGSLFTNKTALQGVRLKRNLSAHRPIQHRDVCYVCVGDKVTIRAVKGELAIKASGIALSDGNIGNNVKVKNSRTQRIVIGKVHSLNEVYVTF